MTCNSTTVAPGAVSAANWTADAACSEPSTGTRRRLLIRVVALSAGLNVRPVDSDGIYHSRGRRRQQNGIIRRGRTPVPAPATGVHRPRGADGDDDGPRRRRGTAGVDVPRFR